MGALTTTEPTTDERVRAAALVCIGRWGLAKTTLDDIARESGVSRATIYRVFPGGKDVLMGAVLDNEVEYFFRTIASELDGRDDLADLLVHGIGTALRLLAGHDALRSVLQHEPELVLPELAAHRFAEILGRAATFAAVYLRPHVGSDDAAFMAAEFTVRAVVSYALTPSRYLDPADPASLARFVATFLLPVFRPPAGSTS